MANVDDTVRRAWKWKNHQIRMEQARASQREPSDKLLTVLSLLFLREPHNRYEIIVNLAMIVQSIHTEFFPPSLNKNIDCRYSDWKVDRAEEISLITKN